MKTRKQFKENYSTYRRAVSNFNSKLENGNFPCGHDDMLCENFEHHTIKYLKDKPVLKRVLDNLDCLDGKYFYNGVTYNYNSVQFKLGA